METEKTFADSKRTVCLGTGEAKFEVEYQESLPQYCEDVERVVRCVCSHAVTDYEYASGSKGDRTQPHFIGVYLHFRVLFVRRI